MEEFLPRVAYFGVTCQQHYANVSNSFFISMLHFPEGHGGEAMNFQTRNVHSYIEEYCTEK
jgi:hypothetical protein